MTVSKRGIVKVIILLVIIDIIAGFWYLTLRIESSGESRDLWHPDSVVENADTIADYTVPDSFVVVKTNGYFVSTLHSDTSAHQLACVKKVAARVPIAINGCDSLDLLNREIILKAFGITALDIEGAMSRYTAIPAFENNALPYQNVEKEPKLGVSQTIATHINIYPLYTSHRMMVIEIDITHNNRGKRTHNSAFVHYDRVAQHVIKPDDIINTLNEIQLLSIINEKIKSLNTANPGLALSMASKLPTELCVRRDHTSFYFASGVIASDDKGEIEVRLSHNDLQKIYTPTFTRLMNASTGWWQYKSPN